MGQLTVAALMIWGMAVDVLSQGNAACCKKAAWAAPHYQNVRAQGCDIRRSGATTLEECNAEQTDWAVRAGCQYYSDCEEIANQGNAVVAGTTLMAPPPLHPHLLRCLLFVF